ncbi:cupredoxin domain-containing protein [Methylomonas paludis]|uniref:Cupredoxin domain-containing protein n=1 Tax=Methylomonas paludis TaxID=1173101 RepID=A0A975MMH3_9GAMM|nr:cupredoxin domain-containing protein [Methylomonas paludis]QWF70512.1 cupredoxin domain-containing protein [Methylomonas paludis]
MNHKLMIIYLLALATLVADTHADTNNAAEADIPVIVITASRFVYSPNQITIKKGQTVLLEIQATDTQHGFSIPDLGVRVDAIPGEKKTIKITPTKNGRFVFYCDIFCGSGHEQMAGEIIVET